jgi:hypothetical protein
MIIRGFAQRIGKVSQTPINSDRQNLLLKVCLSSIEFWNYSTTATFLPVARAHLAATLAE